VGCARLAGTLAGQWVVDGLVELTIDPAAQAKVMGVPVTLKALRVSVTDPDALIAACTKTA
jgi:hypothetical protein